MQFYHRAWHTSTHWLLGFKSPSLPPALGSFPSHGSAVLVLMCLCCWFGVSFLLWTKCSLRAGALLCPALLMFHLPSSTRPGPLQALIMHLLSEWVNE